MSIGRFKVELHNVATAVFLGRIMAMISVFLSQLEDVYQTKAKQGTIAWPVGTDWGQSTVHRAVKRDRRLMNCHRSISDHNKTD